MRLFLYSNLIQIIGWRNETTLFTTSMHYYNMCHKIIHASKSELIKTGLDYIYIQILINFKLLRSVSKIFNFEYPTFSIKSYILD